MLSVRMNCHCRCVRSPGCTFQNAVKAANWMSKERSKVLTTKTSKIELFPTCQARVVRFYVSLPSSASFFFFSSAPPPPLLLNGDAVRSVLRAGPQPRSCEISVPRRTSTAILWDQCSAPDLNRDPVRSVFRAGPQPRSCEISVPRRTSTAILWDQCSAPDLNRDPLRSVFRAGPQPQSCEFSVPRRTSTAILWDQCSAPDLNRDPVRKKIC